MEMNKLDRIESTGDGGDHQFVLEALSVVNEVIGRNSEGISSIKQSIRQNEEVMKEAATALREHRTHVDGRIEALENGMAELASSVSALEELRGQLDIDKEVAKPAEVGAKRGASHSSADSAEYAVDTETNGAATAPRQPR